MSLSKKEFDNYASRGFNRIPLMREVLADLRAEVARQGADLGIAFDGDADPDPEENDG